MFANGGRYMMLAASLGGEGLSFTGSTLQSLAAIGRAHDI